MLKGKAGESFLIETNIKDGQVTAHLFILILNVEAKTGNTIIVNIDTIRNRNYDQTVIVKAGEHPFVKHDSFINYSRARIRSVGDLRQLIDSGCARLRETCSTTLLEKICSGILRSPFTIGEVREMYMNDMFRSL